MAGGPAEERSQFRGRGTAEFREGFTRDEGSRRGVAGLLAQRVSGIGFSARFLESRVIGWTVGRCALVFARKNRSRRLAKGKERQIWSGPELSAMLCSPRRLSGDRP